FASLMLDPLPEYTCLPWSVLQRLFFFHRSGPYIFPWHHVTLGGFTMTTRLQWLGHSTLLLETDGTQILIDPFIKDNPKCPVKPDKISADFILVSHGHGDHLGDAIPIAKRTGATIVCNYEISVWLQAQGLEKVHGMQHGGSWKFPFGRVKLTLA